MTEDHAKLFVDAFKQEVARITQNDDQRDEAASARLDVVTRELENLAANLLQGVLSPTLQTLLANREAEKIILEARLAAQPATSGASILPHPMLLRRFEEKVAALRETLDDEAVRGEAAEILSTLIESVTIYPQGAHGPEAEVVAKVSDLMTWATNDNAAPKGGVCSSMAVVAGTRTGRCNTSPVINI